MADYNFDDNNEALLIKISEEDLQKVQNYVVGICKLKKKMMKIMD